MNFEGFSCGGGPLLAQRGVSYGSRVTRENALPCVHSILMGVGYLDSLNCNWP